MSFFLEAKSDYATEYEHVYAKIKDICNPTIEEFRYLQHYLNHGERPYLQWLNTFYQGEDGLRYDIKVKNLCLIETGWNKEKLFKLNASYFNNTPADKDKCIISFASLNYNYNYHNKVRELGTSCYEKGYCGHYLWRVGGWPDIKGGSLRFAHVPYGFKISMMKEARDLGYKKVLWLDSSMRALKDCSPLFEIMERDGYLLWAQVHLYAHGTEMARKALGLTIEEFQTQRQSVGGIIGINFEHPNGKALFEAWYKATEDLDPYLSPRPEQVCLGAIAYKLGLSFMGNWDDVYTGDKNWIQPYHYFFVCY